MKSITLLATILFLSFLTFGQISDPLKELEKLEKEPELNKNIGIKNTELEEKIKTFQNKSRFKITYDKFKDITEVRFSSFSLYPSKESAGMGIPYFGVTFSYAGEVLKSNAESFYLLFSSTSSSWKYLKNHGLIFLVDGERISLGDGKHSGKVNTSRRSVSVSEFMYFAINRNDLEAIAKSKQTEFQLGAFTGTLTDEHKQMLVDIVNLSATK